MTDVTSAATKFSAELFAAFWAAPDLSHGLDILADDIVGYWPGDPEPVRGVEAYTAKIAEILDAAPDLQLQVVDSATVDGSTAGEQLVFLHYTGRGTGRAVPDPGARPSPHSQRDRRGKCHPLRPVVPRRELSAAPTPCRPRRRRCRPGRRAPPSGSSRQCCGGRPRWLPRT
jgi:SnoaL-like domain